MSDGSDRTIEDKRQVQMFDEGQQDAMEEVSADLSSLLRSATEEIDEQILTGIGNELTSLFAAVDRAVLNPGFGGLIELPKDHARLMVNQWVEVLHNLKYEKHISMDVPGTFICRMLEDGSLFLKRINLPAGVVVSSDSVQEEQEIAPAKKRKSTKKAQKAQKVDRTPARAPVATTEPDLSNDPNQMSLADVSQEPGEPQNSAGENGDQGARRTLVVGHGGSIQVRDQGKE